MNDLQDLKFVNVVSPSVGVDNGAFTTASIDTQGYDWCTIIVQIGNLPANMAALKVQESDDDGSSDAYADVDNCNASGGVDTDGNTVALPAAASDDDTIWVFEIDLRGRDRYLDLVATAGDGSGTETGLSAIAVLGRGKLSPTTASDRGAEHVIRPYGDGS